jgi:hypothetical protein
MQVDREQSTCISTPFQQGSALRVALPCMIYSTAYSFKRGVERIVWHNINRRK